MPLLTCLPKPAPVLPTMCVTTCCNRSRCKTVWMISWNVHANLRLPLTSVSVTSASTVNSRITYTSKRSPGWWQSVTDDPEMIAAAWLHDTVEDTPATLDDIEEYFGASVAELVEELTDVSKPSDGNRAQRKAIDRLHSAQASARSKTVKLADLIDNCKDIARHDERFARVFLVEMGALLKVLAEGDQNLFGEASKLHAKHVEKLGISEAAQIEPELWEPDRIGLHGFDDRNFKRMFTEIFTARDIAEGLLSFDADTPCEQAARNLKDQRREVASVRISGNVQGYIRAADLGDGECAECFRHFTVDQVLNGTATFSDVIHVLTRHDYCFVNMLGNVAGVIRRDDINKPMVRMWLFGIVTMVEMGLVELIHERFPDDSWEAELSEGRLQESARHPEGTPAS